MEDFETLALLRDFGCDIAQGFLIAAPLQAAELAPWVLNSMHEWRRRLGPQKPVLALSA